MKIFEGFFFFFFLNGEKRGFSFMVVEKVLVFDLVWFGLDWLID